MLLIICICFERSVVSEVFFGVVVGMENFDYYLVPLTLEHAPWLNKDFIFVFIERSFAPEYVKY